MALEPGQKLPPLSEALAGSVFEENLDCIEGAFERLQITTVRALDNSPRDLTCAFCMCSTHKLIEHIRNYMESEPQTEVASAAVEEAESLFADPSLEEEE